MLITETPVICNDCWDEMQKIFTFKSRCIDIEDYLTPFFESGNITDLTIILNNIKSENGDSENVCRLCMQATIDNYELKNSETEVFQKFLPEVVSTNNYTQIIIKFRYICIYIIFQYNSFNRKFFFI